MKSTTLARLQAERAAKRAVVLLTRLSDGAQLLWPGDEMPAELVEASKAALGSEEAGNVALGDETWFIHPHNPPQSPQFRDPGQTPHAFHNPRPRRPSQAGPEKSCLPIG